MKIDIPDSLYHSYLRFLKERFCSDDVSGHIQQILELEMKKASPGYCDLDELTQCKSRYRLENDILRATWGDSSHDDSFFRENYLCIDIDDFKSILDVRGLSAGDSILQEIAEQLRTYYGDANVYRFGGDEFVVLVGDGRYVPLELSVDVPLKYSIVRVSAQKNRSRNHHVNRAILFFLDKGIVEARPGGNDVICEIKAAC